jgi:hypothetical protein
MVFGMVKKKTALKTFLEHLPKACHCEEFINAVALINDEAISFGVLAPTRLLRRHKSAIALLYLLAMTAWTNS